MPSKKIAASYLVFQLGALCLKGLRSPGAVEKITWGRGGGGVLARLKQGHGHELQCVSALIGKSVTADYPSIYTCIDMSL